MIISKKIGVHRGSGDSPRVRASTIDLLQDKYGEGGTKGWETEKKIDNPDLARQVKRIARKFPSQVDTPVDVGNLPIEEAFDQLLERTPTRAGERNKQLMALRGEMEGKPRKERLEIGHSLKPYTEPTGEFSQEQLNELATDLAQQQAINISDEEMRDDIQYGGRKGGGPWGLNQLDFVNRDEKEGRPSFHPPENETSESQTQARSRDWYKLHDLTEPIMYVDERYDQSPPYKHNFPLERDDY